MIRELFQDVLDNWVQATQQAFSKHPVANLFRGKMATEIRETVRAYEPSLNVEASAGNGNWASVPWISILDPGVTQTTQDGIYPVYLFCADGSGVYLSFNQGVTKIQQELGRKAAQEFINRKSVFLRKSFPKLREWGAATIHLQSKTKLGKSYEGANIAAKFYATNALPSDEILISDLHALLELYKEIANQNEEFINSGIKAISSQDIIEDKKAMEQFATVEQAVDSTLSPVTPLPKPFLILAGISGSGKSRFVRTQAELSPQYPNNYQLVAVRPDWHEPSDVVGYVSHMGAEPRFVVTDCVKFIANAWKALIDAGCQVVDGKVQGEKAQLDAVAPYWLCLDEMNLAPVEQYFADYLVVLETREWQWRDESFTYSSSALVQFNNLLEKGQQQLRGELSLDGEQYDSLWQSVLENGMGLPCNLVVAGTVNMDETTHGFSRKVIDRALTLDFDEFFPNDFMQFQNATKANRALTFGRNSDARSLFNDAAMQAYAEQSVAFLNSLNAPLQSTHFQLGYRALNELLLSVECEQPQDEVTLQAIWDDFVMCKVLPRIEGDDSKLQSVQGNKDILQLLFEVLQLSLAAIWDNEQRPDLHQVAIAKVAAAQANEQPAIERIECRSKRKIMLMQNRLSQFRFTQFWA